VTAPTLTVVRRRLSELTRYPGNARRGDVETIRGSLRVNGQFRPLALQAGTDVILTGNHTFDAMLAEGWEEADCIVLDVDDAAARRIVLADNRTSDLGTYDEGALLTLLRDLENLDGTGYAEEDLADLLAAVEAAEPTVLTPAGPARERAPRETPEYEEAYSSRSTRFIPLNYPLGQYVWLTAALAKIAEEEGVDGPEGAVLRLVENRLQEAAPETEDADT
jgi:hypothetical protein